MKSCVFLSAMYLDLTSALHGRSSRVISPVLPRSSAGSLAYMDIDIDIDIDMDMDTYNCPSLEVSHEHALKAGRAPSERAPAAAPSRRGSA